MATQITPSLRSALERLKNGGAVNGMLLGWKRQLLINLLPYEDFRAGRLLETIRDARDHFGSGGDRHLQCFWFGYETCHLLVLFRGESTLIILHARAEEADFLKRAAITFMEDCQLLIDSLLNPSAEVRQADDEDDLGPHSTNLLGRVS